MLNTLMILGVIALFLIGGFIIIKGRHKKLSYERYDNILRTNLY